MEIPNQVWNDGVWGLILIINDEFPVIANAVKQSAHRIHPPIVMSAGLPEVSVMLPNLKCPKYSSFFGSSSFPRRRESSVFE